MAAATENTNAGAVNRNAHPFVRANLEELLARRFFTVQSFQIYKECAGFYDLGEYMSPLQGVGL